MYLLRTGRYTPDSGFVGTDSFVYEVTDANSNVSTATVSIDVAATVFDVGDVNRSGSLTFSISHPSSMYYPRVSTSSKQIQTVTG